jgi:hypothetical protein
MLPSSRFATSPRHAVPGLGSGKSQAIQALDRRVVFSIAVSASIYIEHRLISLRARIT